jgi:hypothetical protein
MSDLPNPNRYIPTAQNGGVWEGTVNDLTDEFLSNFNMEVYTDPVKRLPVYSSEYFLTKNKTIEGHPQTYTLSIRLPLAVAAAAPTIHLSWPAS